ncbi:MAG: LamG-like jellyroll fold domain-containing protein [Coprococcus sp.]
MTKGTFSFAYRLNEATVGKTIYGLLSLSNSNADREYGALYIKPKDNRIGYEVQGKGDKYITVRNGNSVNNAEWHTVTYAFDGTQAEFYLDGVSIGKFATTHLLKR